MYRQVIEDFTVAINLNPKDAKAHYNRGVAYRKLGSDRQGFEDVKAAARMGHKDAQDLLKSKRLGW